jgi:flagellin-specific chaperone FliS
VKNTYEPQELPTQEFLSVTYKLMLKKVLRLKEIEGLKVRNKLPLPLLKEKLEIISKLLDALRVLNNSIDFNTEMGNNLSSIFNDFSIMLTIANISETEEAIQKYDSCVAILDGFLGNK